MNEIVRIVVATAIATQIQFSQAQIVPKQAFIPKPPHTLGSKLENGVLCGVDVEQPRMFAATSTGSLLFDRALSLERAINLQLFSCAVSASGAIVFSGGAYDSEGRIAAFLAIADRSGSVSKLLRTDGFTAFATQFDSANRLWAVGIEQGALKRKGDPRDLVVRSMDTQGKIQSNLKLSYPITDPSQNGSIDHPHITVTSEHLVILRKEWNEVVFVSRATGDVQRVKFKKPFKVGIVIGFVSTPGGRIFLKVQEPRQPRPENVYTIYEWNGESQDWVKIQHEQLSQAHAILGIHEGLLLTSYKSEHLWVPIP